MSFPIRLFAEIVPRSASICFLRNSTAARLIISFSKHQSFRGLSLSTVLVIPTPLWHKWMSHSLDSPIKSVQPHRPLIKFRNGPSSVRIDSGRASANSSPRMVAPPAAAASAPSSGLRTWTPVQRGAVLEEWQVPARYRRLPIDEKEIEIINMGGSA